MRQGRGELQEVLDTYVFTEANVESSTQTSVTYLMRGSVMCQDAPSPQELAECAGEVDQRQMRLEVTAPSQNDVRIRAMVGPDRAAPFAMTLSPTSMGVEMDLAQLKAALVFVANTWPQMGFEASQLPRVMQGSMRVQGSWSQDQVQMGFSVLDPVQVTDASLGFDVRLGAATDMLSVGFDAAANTVRYVADVRGLDALFPLRYEEFVHDEIDVFDYETRQVDTTMRLRAQTLKAEGTWSSLQDTLDIALDLGSTPLSMDVDGKTVLAAGLSTGVGGGMFVGKLTTPDGGDTVTLTAVSELTAALKMAFAPVAGVLQDDGLRDPQVNETYQVGAQAGTEVTFDDFGGLVSSGGFTLGTQSDGQLFSVAGGQCFDNGGSGTTAFGDLQTIPCD